MSQHNVRLNRNHPLLSSSSSSPPITQPPFRHVDLPGIPAWSCAVCNDLRSHPTAARPQPPRSKRCPPRLVTWDQSSAQRKILLRLCLIAHTRQRDKGPNEHLLPAAARRSQLSNARLVLPASLDCQRRRVPAIIQVLIGVDITAFDKARGRCVVSLPQLA